MRIKWHFIEKPRGAKLQNPLESTLFKGDPITGVLRELVQNSIDAALPHEKSCSWNNGGKCECGTGPVRIEIGLKGLTEKLSPPSANEFFPNIEEMWEHFKDDEIENKILMDMPAINHEIDYFTFEDFNTRGLTGDITADTDYFPSHAEYCDKEKGGNCICQDFYWFVRNIGRTGKGFTQMGSWGIGKTTIPASSRIHTFFALTERFDDKKQYLTGQNILASHFLDTDRKQYIAYTDFGKKEPSKNSMFVLPVDNTGRLKMFAKLFNLRRKVGQPGTSIVVPYPVSTIREKEFVRTTILQYFYPILKGRLEIIIRGADRTFKLDAATLLKRAEMTGLRTKEFNSTDINELLVFAKEIIDGKFDPFVLKNAGVGRAAKHYSFEESDAIFNGIDIDGMRRKFHQEKAISVEFPISLRKKDGKIARTFFRVFLQKDDFLAENQIHYIRRDLLIDKNDPKIHQDAGIRAILLIEDSELVQFLNASEDPGHNKWNHEISKMTTRMKENYDEHGLPSVIHFIVKSIRNLNTFLDYQPEEKDMDLLEEFFSIESISAPEETDSGDDVGDEAGGGDKIKKPVSTRNFVFGKIRNGVRVSVRKGATGIPQETTVEIAYTTRGNSYNKYSEWDFDLRDGDFTIKPDKCEITNISGNKIKLKAISNESSLRITGFGNRRMIDVRAIPR